MATSNLTTSSSGEDTDRLGAAFQLFHRAKAQLNALGPGSATSSAPAEQPQELPAKAVATIAAYQEAVSAFEACEAVIVAKPLAKCFVGMAACYSHGGPGSVEAEESLRCAKAAVDADPSYFDGYISRAGAAMALEPTDGWLQAECDLIRARQLLRQDWDLENHFDADPAMFEMMTPETTQVQTRLQMIRKQRAAIVDQLQDTGREHVQRRSYREAVEVYTQAIKFCVASPDTRARAASASAIVRQSRLLSNRALCFLRLNSYHDAQSDCEQALALDSSNEKAGRWLLIASREIIENGDPGLDASDEPEPAPAQLEKPLLQEPTMAEKKAAKNRKKRERKKVAQKQAKAAGGAAQAPATAEHNRAKRVDTLATVETIQVASSSEFDLLTNDLLALIVVQLNPLSSSRRQHITPAEWSTCHRAVLSVACVSQLWWRVCACAPVGEALEDELARVCASSPLTMVSQLYWSARRNSHERSRLGRPADDSTTDSEMYWGVRSASHNHQSAFLEEQRQFAILDSIAEYFTRRCCDNPFCKTRPRPQPHNGLVLTQVQRSAWTTSEAEGEGAPGCEFVVAGAQERLREGCIQSCLNVGSLPKLDVCGRCKSASYCNRACQKAAWSSHKHDCMPHKEIQNPKKRAELFGTIGHAWSESLSEPYNLLDEEDFEILEAQTLEETIRQGGIQRSMQNLLGNSDCGDSYAIPCTPMCWPMSLRFFCSQFLVFGSGLTNDATPRAKEAMMAEVHEQPEPTTGQIPDYLNDAGLPCMDPTRMMESTCALMRLAVCRLYNMPDHDDEEHFVRGVDNNDTGGLGLEGSFVDAMFPLARSVVEHQLLFLGGRRDYKSSYALFYIDIKPNSPHYGGVYFQTGYGVLETVAHDPTTSPRWRSFADFAQYVFFSQGSGAWCDYRYWGD
jgi:tetratricopeptide (TPR) repeat protein